MKRLTEEQIAQIIELYGKGKTPTELANQFGIYNNSVTRLLRKHGIDRNQQIRVSQEKIDQIISEYNSGVSSEIIALKLGINGSTVCRILKRNGINIRPGTQNKRKYKINEDFFEAIDTEERAYFLGLMYADGSLSKRASGISITLEQKDIHILETFSNIIYGFIKLVESSNILIDGTEAKYNTLSFYSQKIHNDLKRWGCTPKKSFTITFPKNLSLDMYPHFIRGFFDGDGSICIEKCGKIVVDFTSSQPFLEGLSNFIEENLGIKINQFYQRHKDRDTNTRNFQIGRREDIIRLMEYLYNDATVYLHRKRAKYEASLEEYKSRDRKKVAANLDISKYGTTYIPSYNNQILNSDTLKTISSAEKDHITDFLLDFYRANGFPYTQLDDNELFKDFTSLKNIDPQSIENGKVLTTYNMSGLQLFKHFSPHFFEVNSGTNRSRKSMLDTFNDDDLLKKVIKNRLDGNFNMTGNMLKQGLSNSKVAYKASIFNPAVAKFIYSRYTKEGDIIYDYSMGFGQRLTAALSLPYSITYVGADPMQRTVDSNAEIFSFLKKNVPMLNKQVELICKGSENYCDPKYHGQISLAFSCPPYFNVEMYEDSSSQAYFGDNYLEFINGWWRKTMQNIVELLKDDGIFALNIKERIDGFNLGEDTCNVARECGLKLTDTYQVQLTRNKSFGWANGEYKYEPIYVFVK